MAYRTFKRLLGETNLERKCRWLLGTGTLVLMGASFLIYARLTEDLAYDQLTHTGRTLVPPIVARLHSSHNDELRAGLAEFQKQAEETWPDNLKGYRYKLIIPNATETERQPDADDGPSLRQFDDNPEQREADRRLRRERRFVYYGAVRASDSCVVCHRSDAKLATFFGNQPATPEKIRKLANPNLQPGDLMAIARIELSTEFIEDGLHTNRAWLIAFAVFTTIAILAGIYVIIRYVVVRPVKELKNTTDAIANGNYTVRSDVRTGDEFEDLSQAFNRMLTNLIQTQERNKELLTKLEVKLDELARTNLELHQSNSMKSEYLSTMSHELRTPLNSVIGFSETLLNAENLTDKQVRWASNIHDSGKNLLALINDVLVLAKAESGKMRVRPEVLNVPTLCEQLGMLFRHQAEKKEIELLVSVDPATPDIRTDAGKLRQILSNLLSNAVKFTPDGGRITLKAEVQGDVVTFTVTDTGIGIAAEHQDVVFQKFRQTSAMLTREAGGTGLGLSIVRELAKVLGGDVKLSSELGRGSTFTVALPKELPGDPLAAFAEEPVEDVPIVND